MNHIDNNINKEIKSYLKKLPTLSEFQTWMDGKGLRILLENCKVNENYRPNVFFEPVVTNTSIVIGGRFL